jgi:Asp-tRNA(Asn)/Glu-tRNA(Gln) amidotransferase B subunit
MGEHKQIPLTRIHLEEDVGKLNHGAAPTRWSITTGRGRR